MIKIAKEYIKNTNIIELLNQKNLDTVNLELRFIEEDKLTGFRMPKTVKIEMKKSELKDFFTSKANECGKALSKKGAK